jgi:hypothetical protein
MNNIQKKNINFQLEYSIYYVKSIDEAYYLGKPCKLFYIKRMKDEFWNPDYNIILTKYCNYFT